VMVPLRVLFLVRMNRAAQGQMILSHPLSLSFNHEWRIGAGWVARKSRGAVDRLN
jgi:hypothetical protein